MFLHKFVIIIGIYDFNQSYAVHRIMISRPGQSQGGCSTKKLISLIYLSPVGSRPTLVQLSLIFNSFRI